MGIVLPRLLNYLLLTPFYTRVFRPDEYGVITELYAYVVFLLVILTYGMETGFFRFSSNTARGRDIYKTVVSAVFSTSVIFIVLIIFFLGPVSSGLGYEQNPRYILWLSIIVGIDAFTAIPFARIRLLNKPVKYTIIRIAEVLVNIGLNLFFLLYCPNNSDKAFVDVVYNPQIGVGYVLISNLVASVIKLLLLSGEIFGAVKGEFDRVLLRKILKYSYPLLIAGLAGTVNEALDRVLLKHLIAPDDNPLMQLGIYGANYKIAVLMTLYVQMFKYAAEPFFFSKSKRLDAKALYADVLRYFLIPALLIFLVVMLYIDYFKLFIGSEFRSGVKIVPVVLFANLVMGIFFNLSIWYKLTNKTIYGAGLVIIGALITIVINVIFIPVYGFYASAWGHLICYSVMVALSYALSRKHYHIKYDIKRILFYIAFIAGLFAADKFIVVNLPGISNYMKPVLIIISLLVFYFMERKGLEKYKSINYQKAENES